MKKSILFFILIFAITIANSQAPGKATIINAPESHGFSSERLHNITKGVKSILKHEETPGGVVAIVRKGELIYTNTFGYQDLKKKIPMDFNSIFRIYSMTKPITSVATMQLWEQGLIKLDDPIHLYIPEFEHMKVAIENEDKSKIIKMVSMERPITIQDLLRHTSGLTYGKFGPKTAVRKEWIKSEHKFRSFTSADFIKEITKLPLIGQPGKRWEYSYSTDVLGRLIEVVSGQELGDYFKEHIFTPLGMNDTGFYIPKEKLHRAAQGHNFKTNDYPTNFIDVAKKPKMSAGGGGLTSTISDYIIFTKMLLNNGSYNGKHLLGRKTVETMTANHMPLDIDKGDLFLPGDGHGFGLGFAVRLEKGMAATPGSKDDFRWGGWAGTGFWIDPAEEMISIFMVQDPKSSAYLRDRYKALVYQALINE